MQLIYIKSCYKKSTVPSVYLEEYARGQIRQEEQHALEIKKMLKDFA